MPLTAPAASSIDTALQAIEAWFMAQGRTPFAFQRQTWRAFLEGRSGLVHAPTGSGKTLSVFGGPIGERLAEGSPPVRRGKRDTSERLRVLWITPLRALAADTTHALSTAVEQNGLNWSIELRTSDTSQSIRKKQRDRLPTVLVTTPESLSLLISYEDAREKLTGLRCVIMDEWHELLSTKRGVQAELGLARLRAFTPGLRTWGLSATLANLPQAAECLLGTAPLGSSQGVVIHAEQAKAIAVESLLPESIEKFPWGGHMGLRMTGPVIRELEKGGSTLLFTNTRAQTELWFRALMQAKPKWMGEVAVHHGSLDRKLRREVEEAIRAGAMRAVVCTSSLDLGVDFSAVDRVIQVGSPKGIGRLMQRAGRSGHAPGQVSRVYCVPTHAFELIEFSAAREGIANKAVEPRVPLRKPLDVLVQHLVTVAAGGGFLESELKGEVRATYAFAELTDEEWGWCLDFVARGGASLRAYPRFVRARPGPDGVWRVASDTIARMHRLGIGTISGDGMITIVTTGNKRLGSLEESYIGRMHHGDFFVFAGHPLEFLGVREMVARVRVAKKRQGTIPQWPGGRFPMSTQLAAGVRKRLGEARDGLLVDAEMTALAPLLSLQMRWSHLPGPGELLIETAATREGRHAFVYGFMGRLVHEGLGALLAYRIKRTHNVPVTATFNDYGIEILFAEPIDLNEAQWRDLLSEELLVEHLLACLNAGQLARRQFRDIARVAGLVLATVPGAPKSTRQLQASSELFFDVFNEFDPDNLLLRQAQREVLEQQLEINRLKTALAQLAGQAIVMRRPKQITPLAFPIWAQRIGSQTIRVEEAGSRIERMVARLERAVEETAP
ncbi:MAG TPA: ligase-associated DNA damage response DEXH box helicase [Tepidisphaeraceae bacterium]